VRYNRKEGGAEILLPDEERQRDRELFVLLSLSVVRRLDVALRAGRWELGRFRSRGRIRRRTIWNSLRESRDRVGGARIRLSILERRERWRDGGLGLR
jgi:hypothetical protein